MKTILRLTPLMILLAIACDESDSPLTPPEPSLLMDVQTALAPYQDLDFALEAGYEAVSPCLEDPILGGMGVHYGNRDLIFSRGVDAFRPEMLVYEPMPDGSMRLVATEYLVPFRVWGSDDPPTLFDQTLARNEEVQAYTLHVWVWKDNPAGIFADWNPEVSCDHAVEIQPASADVRHIH